MDARMHHAVDSAGSATITEMRPFMTAPVLVRQPALRKYTVLQLNPSQSGESERSYTSSSAWKY